MVRQEEVAAGAIGALGGGVAGAILGYNVRPIIEAPKPPEWLGGFLSRFRIDVTKPDGTKFPRTPELGQWHTHLKFVWVYPTMVGALVGVSNGVAPPDLYPIDVQIIVRRWITEKPPYYTVDVTAWGSSREEIFFDGVLKLAFPGWFWVGWDKPALAWVAFKIPV